MDSTVYFGVVNGIPRQWGHVHEEFWPPHDWHDELLENDYVMDDSQKRLMIHKNVFISDEMMVAIVYGWWQVGGWWYVVGGWWYMVGGWWYVVGGWWLVVGSGHT